MDYADEIIRNLERLKDSYGNVSGRWNEVYLTNVPENPSYAGSNLDQHTEMANGHLVGGDFHRLTINISDKVNSQDEVISSLSSFENFADYNNSFAAQQDAGYWVGGDIEYLFNHEFGHKLTTPNNIGGIHPTFIFSEEELMGLSIRGREVDMDEALAEIFAIFESGDDLYSKYITVFDAQSPVVKLDDLY